MHIISHFQRFFTGWCHAYTIAPTLLGALEGHTLDDVQKQISNCLIKVYTLCEYVANAARRKVHVNFSENTKINIFKHRFAQKGFFVTEILDSRHHWNIYSVLFRATYFYSILQSNDVQDVLRNLGGEAARYLPESTVLEFLLNVKSPVLRTVEDYLRMYSDISPCAFWDGKKKRIIYIYFIR